MYEGNVPVELAAAAHASGSGLAVEDFAAYKVVERTPIIVHWEGNDVYTMPAPSAGGLMLAETLDMFTRDELRKLGAGSGAYQHLVAEGMRGAVADRMAFVGDPELGSVDMGKLLAPDRLAARRRSITLDRTHPMPQFLLREHGTHHIVTADADGNVVSLTTTVNRPFGAWVTGPKTGVVLNDELDDFTSIGTTKTLGIGATPNAPRAGARPTSSMTPTIVVRDGAPVLALGGSGGTTIASNVTLALLSRLVFDEAPALAVSEPRFAVPTEGSTIALEASASPDLRPDLEHRGEVVSIQKPFPHAVQMIAIEGGKKLAASDPRKHGFALAE
jgi:gamma-glutamyltranspeptidase/glutathione hydrolase